MAVLGLVYAVLSLVGWVAGLWFTPVVTQRIEGAGRSRRAALFVTRLGNFSLGLAGFSVGIMVTSGADLDQPVSLIFPMGAGFGWLLYGVLTPLLGVRGQIRETGRRLWADFKRGTTE